MPLPDSFSPAAHLISTVAKAHNKLVQAFFKDVGDISWTADISTPRASLRVACTILNEDSMDMVKLRIDLFYIICGKARAFQTPIYGIPSIDFQEVTRYYPQVALFFEEKSSNVETSYTPLRSQIKFRLTDETSESFTKQKAIAIANKIKSIFGSNTAPFEIKRGKELYSYVDQFKGYYFQLYVFDVATAKKVITAVLNIRAHTPDWTNLDEHKSTTPLTAYPTIPPKKVILGTPVQQPRVRPVGTVRYRYATLYLYGAGEPLTLHDLTGYRKKPLVK
jgi:hypothetical protein